MARPSQWGGGGGIDNSDLWQIIKEKIGQLFPDMCKTGLHKPHGWWEQVWVIIGENAWAWQQLVVIINLGIPWWLLIAWTHFLMYKY